jgi:hypothetical protein
MAAPASTAWRDAVAISSCVTGRCGDIVGVWIPPVGAQVMMMGFGMDSLHARRTAASWSWSAPAACAHER